jgi:hypothetical protein
LQATNVLGNFVGTGASFATWQYVLLTSNGVPAVLSLGGVKTLQMKGDGKENANFFALVPIAVAPVTIVPTNSPVITGFSLVGGVGGNNVVINGTNGNAGATYYLLTSTNVATPLIQWKAVATNVVGTTGPTYGFTFIGTNVVSPNGAKQFYILSGTSN